MNITIDMERVAAEMGDEINEVIRDVIVAAVRQGTARAINTAITAYYESGPGKQAVEDALYKSLAGRPIHV